MDEDDQEAAFSETPIAAAGSSCWLDEKIDSADSAFIWRALLPLALGNAADAVEILSAGYILSSYRRNDGTPLTGTQKELLTAAVFVGMLVGGLLAGSAADRFGRRLSLLVSLTVNFVFGILSAATPSVAWLIAARVCAGLGVGGSIPTVFTLGAELFPTAMRGKTVSAIASFWMVGSIFAATAAWVVLGDGFGGARICPGGTWRHYAVVAAVPAASALVLTVLYVPESPRYFASAGRYNEMGEVLAVITNGSVHVPPSAFVAPRPGRRSSDIWASRWQTWRHRLGGGMYNILPLGLLNEGLGGNEPHGAAGKSSRSHGGLLRVLWASGNTSLRRSTVVLVTVWFAISYGTYGIGTWNNQLFADIGLSNPYLCSFIYSLSNLPGNVASVLLVDKTGRKRLLAISMGLAAGAATLFAFGSRSGAGLVVLSACLFNAFSTCGWNALGVVSTEAFPTVARVSGLGLVSAAGRLGSISAQFVNGSLEDSVLELLFVTSGLTMLGAAVSLLLPRETCGSSLEAVRLPGDAANGSACHE